jgi:hypothetical protein
VLDDEPHEVFLQGEEEASAGLLHQGHHQLEDPGHVADHHVVVLPLSGGQEGQEHIVIRNALLMSFCLNIDLKIWKALQSNVC